MSDDFFKNVRNNPSVLAVGMRVSRDLTTGQSTTQEVRYTHPRVAASSAKTAAIVDQIKAGANQTKRSAKKEIDGRNRVVDSRDVKPNGEIKVRPGGKLSLTGLTRREMSGTLGALVMVGGELVGGKHQNGQPSLSSPVDGGGHWLMRVDVPKVIPREGVLLRILVPVMTHEEIWTQANVNHMVCGLGLTTVITRSSYAWCASQPWTTTRFLPPCLAS